MREILFRGKDLQDQNGWIYGQFYKSDYNKRERESGKATLIFTPDCDTFIYVPEYHNSWMVKAETVGEFTGVKDKNGKKIFEHDIVRIAVCGTYDNYVVSYDKENARFVVGDIDFTMVRIFSPKIEVIGNIHDNPELLKGE